MKYHRPLFGLILFAGTALVLGSPLGVQAQSFGTAEPFPEDLPATGDINDLNGLQERQVGDWFPQQTVSNESQTLLEINASTYPTLTINDRSSQLIEEADWQRTSSGEPRRSGSGLPLGTF